jgi:hypothetical protein
MGWLKVRSTSALRTSQGYINIHTWDCSRIDQHYSGLLKIMSTSTLGAEGYINIHTWNCSRLEQHPHMKLLKARSTSTLVADQGMNNIHTWHCSRLEQHLCLELLKVRSTSTFRSAQTRDYSRLQY